MSKIAFSQKVKSYLKTAGYSQKVLAMELGMNPSVLTHKLNGTGRVILTQPEIHQIIKTLAKLEAITRQSEASELLAEVDCRQFAFDEWKKPPLDKLSPAQNQLKMVASNPDLEMPAPVLNNALPINNLPKALNSFVGREREIKEVIEFLAGPARLVTLTGSGGTGKTRLAQGVAEILLKQSQFEDGIFFITLENLTTEQDLINELAITLAVKEIAGKSQLAVLKDHLLEARCLLVLDNFEQLAQTAI